MAERLLAIEHVTAGYAGRDVLADVSLDVHAGEMVGVLGPNGAGKSTLLRVAAGTLRPRAGRVLLGESDVHTMRPREVARLVAVLPQESSPVFPTSVLETVLLGRFPWHAALAFESDEDVAAAEAALRDVDASALRDRDLGSLSGGERQRVLLARALCQAGRVLLCDEPTSHLDLRHQAEVFELLARLRDGGRAVVVVTHDLESAARTCDRLVLIAEGRVAAAGAAEDVLTEEHTRAAFGVVVRARREDGTIRLIRDPAVPRRKSP